MIRIPSTFGPAQAVEWLRDWSRGSRAGDLEIVLPDDADLEPAGLSLLAAGVAERHAAGRRTVLVSRRHSAADRLLRERGFFDLLDATSAESAVEEAAPRELVSLRRIVDLRTARLVAEETGASLERRFTWLAPSVLRAARFTLEELGANIAQHSRAPRTGFGVAEVDPGTRRIQIAFADAGVGIRASLQRNHELEGRIADDAQAIDLALQRGVSGGIPGQNMGLGLAFLASFAELLRGDLWIVSGEALLRMHTAGARRERTTHRIEAWRGTWICLDAPLATAEP